MAGAQSGFSGGKRAKERLRAEKKADKEERRRARLADKANATTTTEANVDPDIAHIVPGPQPVTQDDEDPPSASGR
jgi:hypothetical protein